MKTVDVIKKKNVETTVKGVTNVVITTYFDIVKLCMITAIF